MKKIWKRIWSVILVAVVLVSVLPMGSIVYASDLTFPDQQVLHLVNVNKNTWYDDAKTYEDGTLYRFNIVNAVVYATRFMDFSGSAMLTIPFTLLDSSKWIDVAISGGVGLAKLYFANAIIYTGLYYTDLSKHYFKEMKELYSSYCNKQGEITDPEVARKIYRARLYAGQYCLHGWGFWMPFIDEMVENDGFSKTLLDSVYNTVFSSVTSITYPNFDTFYEVMSLEEDVSSFIKVITGDFSSIPLDWDEINRKEHQFDNPEVTTISPSYTVSNVYKKSKYYTALTKVPLTGNQRTDIVNVALSQVGYHEGNNTNQINGTNTNGSKNYTEYAYWFGTQVKGNTYGHYYEWCAMFVSWCARQARIPASVLSNAAYAKADGSSRSGGYSYFHIDYKNRGTYTPQPGDIIFFGNWEHVGIVYKVENGKVYTIEGNSSNKVVIKNYSLNNSNIKCYGIPKYNSSASIQVLNTSYSGSGSSSASLPVSGIDYQPGYYRVTPSIGLNIRKGTGTNYGIVRAVPKGTELKITEISGQWGKCESGWVYMYYTEYIAPIENPVKVPAAPQLNLCVATNLPVGSLVTVTWPVASDAESYDVYLKNSNGTVCQTVNTRGTVAAFSINEPGTFTITANSRNSKYLSSTSNTVTVKIHNPSTVNFVDWNGTVLSSQSVPYGSSATTPGTPGRYGWTFERWDGSYNSVTSDRTITAVYKRNVYTVSFVNEYGEVIGEKQKVEFEGAATAPEYTAPEGYTFLRWDKEFDYIESNLTITPVNIWTNEDLPVTIKSTSDVERIASGYTVKVNVINNPTKATDGRVIVALKTNEGKLLAMTESAAFHLLPDYANDTDNLGEEKSIEVYVPYTGVAHVADIYVVENFSKAIPISAVKSVEINLGTDWTDWSTKIIGEFYESEQRTEYSYQTRSTKTSSKSSLPGWTNYKTTWQWSDYGAWSGWTDSYIAETESRDVDDQTVPASYKTQYLYYHYSIKRKDGGIVSYPQGLDGYQVGSSNGVSAEVHSIALDYPLTYDCTFTTFSGWQTSAYKGYNCCARQPYGSHDRWWYGSGTTTPTTQQVPASYKTQYRYRDRSKVYTYYYEQWSNWSDWSTTEVTATENRNVKTRTTYRYKINDPSITADTSGVLRRASTNPEGLTENDILLPLLPDLAGEQAILFIYKVDEASDFTNEYVGQTKIADDGSYSFEFKLREEPSVKTGDFTVTLGIEGTTEVINVGTIEAPKPTYTVKFIDWDGTEIASQTVVEGGAATMPEIPPTREGYDFICWNSTATNIKDNLVVSPVYRIKTYSVVFVDWTNETVQLHTYEHGQPLMAPELESTDDSVVSGWDTVVDDVLVTEDMIITSKYEPKTFTVKFMNTDDTVLEEIEVEYGKEVTLPEIVDENVIFRDWETSGDLEAVTEDLVVIPKFEYAENTDIPQASIQTGEYDGVQTIVLNCVTDNSTIYYTVDGSDPFEFGLEYTGPLTVSESCQLRFYACALGKNDSEEIVEYYAINTDNNKEHLVVFEMDNTATDNVLFVKDGEKIDLSDFNLEQYGYTFEGTYLDAEFTEPFDINNDKVTESITLYPKWTAENYNVTFIGLDNEIIDEQTVPYLENAQIPEMPKIEGYVFCGFDTDVFTVTDDMVITAKYVPEDEYVTLTLNKNKYRLYKGTSYILKATVTPTDAKDIGVFWRSSDESVVVVDDSGKVTAVGVGTAEIYAISNATGYAATCKVTVMANIDEDITLRDDSDYGFDSEGQLRGVSVSNNTVDYVAEQFENLDLVFVDINGNTLSGNDLVGTGTKVQILNGEEVIDEVVVVVTGDYNGDGYINNRDASMITRYLVDKEYATLTQLTAIDVNGDGYVNNRDASMVSRYLVGKEII